MRRLASVLAVLVMPVLLAGCGKTAPQSAGAIRRRNRARRR